MYHNPLEGKWESLEAIWMKSRQTAIASANFVNERNRPNIRDSVEEGWEKYEIQV